MSVLSVFIHDLERPSGADIERAARELHARYGSAARDLVQERVAVLERSARWGEHASAMRVLSLIERLSMDCTDSG
jgi:hypothetical protein